MPIRFTFVESGQERSTLIDGVVTVSENPPQLNLLVTDPVWIELQEILGGTMILALTMEDPEENGVKESILYLKNEDGRERINNYVFSKDYASSDMTRVEAQVKKTLVKSDQVRKEKPQRWKWSGNVHGH